LKVAHEKFSSLSSAMAAEDRIWLAGAPGSWAWTCANGLSVPASALRLENFAAAAERSHIRGWPVVVRCTGGGCVPQGPGILNFGVMTHSSLSADHLYARFAQSIIDATARFGARSSIFTPEGAWCEGRYDLSIARRKFCGLSQRRSVGTHLRPAFIHAAIFLCPDLDTAFTAMRRFLTEAGAKSAPDRQAATSLAAHLEAPNARLAEQLTGSLSQCIEEMFD